MNKAISSLYDIESTFSSDTYQLKEEIGQGGFGRIFKATQLTTNQEVAIKFLTLSPEFDAIKKERYIKRFERETLLISKLRHPNIVRLLDKKKGDDGLFYAVFEYVEGKTLRQTLAEKGVLTPVEAAEIMAQVLDALAHAHSQGVVHRDIKPSNIMLTTIGAKTHAKILDFGIASLVSEIREHDYKKITLTQETLGTPSYSAPEQLRGEPPTPKTDIYVWGLVFIECLTGRPTINGSNLASIFHKQLSQCDVPLPAALVGHPVAALLRRVLNKKAQGRISDTKELYNEFVQINFSSLVGDLSNSVVTTRSDRANQMDGDDQDTLNINNVFQYTGLTERKQITALCLTLKVKTVLNDAFDLDVADALHRDHKSQCIDIAVRYGGFHVGALADTLLFYFGYPMVSDNDGRLCARAALEIMSNLNKRNSLLKMSQGIVNEARIGIHTGIVTTYADVIPDGDTPNIAVEIARIALPYEVLCSAPTRMALDNYIEFESVKTLSRLGVADNDMSLFLMKGERQLEAFGFLRASNFSRHFVGRDKELDVLLDLLNLDIGKHYRAHIFGEAGIGKSRLLFELRSNAKDFTHFVAQCLPEHRNNALFPILNLIRYKYSLDSESPGEAVDILRGQVRALDGIDECKATPILCYWLGLPVPNDIELSVESPDIQKQFLFSALSALLSQPEISQQPQRCLFIFEDIHWADPTSIEFISQFVTSDSFVRCNHAFFSTSRETIPELLSKIDFIPFEVLRLDPEKTARFIVNLFDNQQVAPAMLDVLTVRTDGIPLFIEELVNMMKQKKLVQRLNCVVDFVDPGNVDEVPSNLRDSLQQKLDALNYAKDTSQLAATIGREFNYDLLVAASTKSEEQLQTDLDELVEMELVFKQRRINGDSYLFKHALVRDAAYESMTVGVLTFNHLQVANTLVSNFPKVARKQPALVANHFSNAQDFLNAFRYGDRSLYEMARNSLNKEALVYSDQVKEWVESVSCDMSRNECQLQFNTTLLPIKTMVEGWGSIGIKTLAEASTLLINDLKDSDYTSIRSEELNQYQHKTEWALLLYHHYQGNRSLARSLGEKLLQKAEVEQDRVKELVIRTTLGQAYFFDGDFKQAQCTLSKVIDSYNIDTDINLYIEYGFDPYHFSAGNLMCIEALTGHLERAQVYYDLCLNHAKATNNIATIITAYTFGTCLFFVLNDREAMAQCTNEVIAEYGDKIESNWIYKYFYMMHDWTKSEYQRAAQTVVEELAGGQNSFLSWYEPSLADTYNHYSMFDQAIQLMTNSLDRSIQSGEMCIVPIAYRYLAISHFKKEGYLCEESINCFNKAIQESRQRGSQWLEFLAIYEYLICQPVETVVNTLKIRTAQLTKEMTGIKGNQWVIKLQHLIM